VTNSHIISSVELSGVKIHTRRNVYVLHFCEKCLCQTHKEKIISYQDVTDPERHCWQNRQ